MDNNTFLIDEIENRVSELESERDSLQEEVDENKMDISKL
eukprot:SAG22_NODE_19060_length_278_cov_1.111732_1_plen_39_part_10